MKVERFILLFVVPVLVFLIWAMDANAEEFLGNSFDGRLHVIVSSDRYVEYHFVIPDSNCVLYYSSNDNILNILGHDYYMNDDNLFSTWNGSQHGNRTAVYERVDSRNGVWSSINYSLFTINGAEFSTDMKIFDSYESASAFLLYGDTSGWLNEPPVDLESNGVLSSDLPTPHLVYSDGGTDGTLFSFDNASSDYCIEIKGRWYSVDDIELYKENAMWKYKYSSTLKNALSVWIPANDKVSSNGFFSLSEIGQSSFDDLLSQYPVDSRTYLGGKNAVSDYLFGYNDALSTLKFLLGSSGSGYNSPEIYVRYFIKTSSGSYIYGKWAHVFNDLLDPNGSSGSRWDSSKELDGYSQSDVGLTDDEVADLERGGYSRSDHDAVHSSVVNNWSYDGMADSFSSFGDMLNNAVNGVGNIPALITTVFGFLPTWLVQMIGLSIAAIILMRILGR